MDPLSRYRRSLTTLVTCAALSCSCGESGTAPPETWSPVRQDLVELASGDSPVPWDAKPAEDTTAQPPESSPFVVIILSPEDGTVVCGTVTILAMAIDLTGQVEMDFLVDGGPIGVDSQIPFLAYWDTTVESKGGHKNTAVARNAAGQEASATIMLLVDNGSGLCDNLPSVAITQPQADVLLHGKVDFAATASDDIGLKMVRFFVDNGLLAADESAPYQTKWDTTGFKDGPHTLKAVAHDSSGQTGASELSVLVDNTPPRSGTDLA